MSTTQAVEDVTPQAVEEVTDSEGAAIVNEIVSPPVDSRVAAMEQLTRAIDAQADIMRAAQQEITRLAGRRRPSLNNHHNLAGVDDGDGYNKAIDAEIARQRALADKAEDTMYRLQGEQAKLTAEIQRDKVVASDPWLGNENKSRTTIDKLERSIRVHHRRLVSDIGTTEQRRVKALEEVNKTALTLGDFQRMRQREFAANDPLKPNAVRLRDSDIKLINDRLTQQRADVAALDDRLSELRTQLERVNKKLDDCELGRVLVRIRALWIEYTRHAEPMGLALSELRTIYESDQRPSPHQDAINASVNWPFACSALKVIAALPRPFFPPSMPIGNESSWENSHNYYYSANTLCTVKEVEK